MTNPPTGASQFKLFQYLSFSSPISPSFWHAFADLNIDNLQLSDAPLSLAAESSRT
ncbi:hypothetical protein V8E36_002704 [Tilletia maclaganii]